MVGYGSERPVVINDGESWRMVSWIGAHLYGWCT